MADPKITTIYGLGADGVYYTSQLAWVPGAPPPVIPPVVVPPIVIPPVVTPPAAAVVMPKVNYHYPVSATLVPPGTGIGLALVKGPVRLGVGAYSGSITMASGEHLYGMGGEMTDCTGLTINIPDGVTGCIISGLFGAKINCNGSVKANTFRRLKWCDINVQSGTFESNLIYGFEAALNILNADWKNNRVIAQTRHGQADPNAYDTLIQSPPGRASINNVMLWRTFQSLPKAMLVQGQGDLAIVGLDVEQSPTIMEASDNGTIRAAVLNGGGNSVSGFGVGADELDIFGGSFGAPGPTVIANGLKRLYTTGITASNTGTIGATFTDASSASALAPILNPVRTGSPWERPSLPTPPNPTIPAGGADATAVVQAAVNGTGFLPAGVYNISRPILLTAAHSILIGAGDGQTVINATNPASDIFQVNLGANIGNAGPPDKRVVTGSICLTDLTLRGGANQLHFNNPGDQPNGCILSHITFRNAAVAGISIDKIYGMDNNFFDYLNFVNCATGIKQIPDPSYPAIPSGQNGALADGTTTMAYIDKTVLYACQFIGCGKGADMQAKRADNLDAFIYSIFKDCGSVGTFSGCNALMFAGCDLINSGILNAQQVYLVSCVLTGTTVTGNAIDSTKMPQLLFGSVMA